MLEYCVHLELEPDASATPTTLRDSIIRAIETWLEESFNKSRVRFEGLAEGAHSLDGGNQVSLAKSESEGETLDTVTWSRPHEIDPTLQWRSIIRLGGLSSGQVALDLTVELTSSVFEARRLPYTQVRPPRLVRYLLSNFRCDGEPPGSLLQPRAVEGNDVEATLVPVLESSTRIYPVVVITPSSRPEVGFPLSPAVLQVLLGGLARVWVLSDEATYTLSNVVGKRRSCFDASIRIYWPGFTRDSNPFLQPLFFGEDVEAAPLKARDRVFEAVRHNASLRWAQSPVIERIQAKVWDIEERVRLAQVKDLQVRLSQSSAAADAERTQLSDRLKAELAKSTELARYTKHLGLVNDDLRQQLRDLASQLEAIQLENSRIKKVARDLARHYVEQGKVEAPPQSTHEAVVRAQARCGNLLITGKAVDIARHSDYPDVEKVYSVLLVADEVAAKLASGATFGHHWGEEIVRIASERGGFSTSFTAHLSPTDKRAQFLKEYEATYISGSGVVKRVIEPHILLQKKGNVQEAARIYLDWDPAIRKLVVSRIGMHPKNLAS